MNLHNEESARERRMTFSLTDAAVELVFSLSEDDLSAGSLDLVTTAILDCLGCTLAGADSPDADIALSWVASLGGNPEAAVLAGSGGAAPASLAALVNGIAGHALDLDDFSPTMMHPSVCLVPAILAVGEREGSSGRDVVLAYAAGFELFARLCRAMNPGHYAAGWHATSTAGTVAAGAAVARLLGLEREGIATAIGIAASSAAGIRQNFGSMVKPYHAGSAAFHGVAAAELAVRGFTAALDSLDGPRGFVAVFGGDPPPAVSEGMFDKGELELDRGGISFKRYACCGAIHAALDATLELRERHGLTAADVASVRCATNRWAPDILIHHSASTASQGRFCVEYSLAVALADGDAGVLQYGDDRIADPQVQDLSSRVEVVVDDGLAVGYSTFPAAVTIETTSGDRHSLQVDVARGNRSTPFTAEELDRKFLGCASLRLEPGQAEQALALARGIRELDDVGALVAAMAGAAAVVS
jgi:2-methylcitrate dehydratase PrpD